MKMCLDNNDGVNLAILQMKSTPVGAGLHGPASLIFNRPIRAMLPHINRGPINFNADDKHYEALRHVKTNTKGNDIHSDPSFVSYMDCSSCPV